MLVDVLMGATTKKLFDARLNEIPQFGNLSNASKDDLHTVVEWLIENNFILKTKGQYPVLHMTYIGIHYDEEMTLKKLKQLKKYLEQ